MGYTSVLVVCPSRAVTGGPEMLHNLAASLNRLGQTAAIVYHPFDRPANTPEPYEKYAVPVAAYADRPGTLLIFPEIYTALALKVRKAEAAIWWLSVNNFTCVRYESPVRDKFRYFRNVLKGRAPWRGVRALRHLSHFAESVNAQEFLKSYGIRSQHLSAPIPIQLEPDYLARLPQRLAKVARSNHILFNPLKGAAATARIRAAFPAWTFRPLRGLDREQLTQAFLSAKLYIDFGHHPGKDGLPREAAIHRCCIITSRYGSAANPIDVPIPDKYKLDVQGRDFIDRFGALAQSIFDNFDVHSRDFERYRAVVGREREEFDREIVKIFG